MSGWNEDQLREAYRNHHTAYEKAADEKKEADNDVEAKKAILTKISEDERLVKKRIVMATETINKRDELQREAKKLFALWLHGPEEEKEPAAIKQEDEDDSSNTGPTRQATTGTANSPKTMTSTTTIGTASSPDAAIFNATVVTTTSGGTKRTVSPESSKDLAAGHPSKKNKSNTNSHSPAASMAAADTTHHFPSLGAGSQPVAGTMVAAPSVTTPLQPPTSEKTTPTLSQSKPPPAHMPSKEKTTPASSTTTPPPEAAVHSLSSTTSTVASVASNPDTAASTKNAARRVQNRRASSRKKQQQEPPVADSPDPLPQHQVQSTTDWDRIRSNCHVSKEDRHPKLLEKVAENKLPLVAKFAPGIMMWDETSQKGIKVPSHVVLNAQWDPLPDIGGKDFVFDYFVHEDDKEAGELLHQTITPVPIFLGWYGGNGHLYYAGDWRVVEYEEYSTARLQTNNIGQERKVCMKLDLQFDSFDSDLNNKIAATSQC